MAPSSIQSSSIFRLTVVNAPDDGIKLRVAISSDLSRRSASHRNTTQWVISSNAQAQTGITHFLQTAALSRFLSRFLIMPNKHIFLSATVLVATLSPFPQAEGPSGSPNFVTGTIVVYSVVSPA